MLASPFAGCAVETGAEEEITVDEEAPPPSVDEAAYCVALPTPSPYDATWTLQPGMTRTETLDDYGDGECDAFGLRTFNLGTFTARPASMPTNGTDCVNTTLSVRQYTYTASGWIVTDTETKTGVWTINGCSLSYSDGVYAAGEVRHQIKIKRITCSGQFCATSYGLPIRASATYGVTPPPPN